MLHPVTASDGLLWGVGAIWTLDHHIAARIDGQPSHEATVAGSRGLDISIPHGSPCTQLLVQVWRAAHQYSGSVAPGQWNRHWHEKQHETWQVMPALGGLKPRGSIFEPVSGFTCASWDSHTKGSCFCLALLPRLSRS